MRLTEGGCARERPVERRFGALLLIAQGHQGRQDLEQDLLRKGSRVGRIWNLRKQLAAGKQYGEMLLLTDDVAEAVEFIVAHPPVKYEG